MSSSPRTPGTAAEKRKTSFLGAKTGSLTAALMAAAKKSPSSSSTRNARESTSGKISRTVSGTRPRIVSGSKPSIEREATPPVPPLPSALTLASASGATSKEDADVKGLDAKTSLRSRTISLLSNPTETRGGMARAKSQASVRTLTPDLPSILDDPISPPAVPRQKTTSDAAGRARLNVPNVVSAHNEIDDAAEAKDNDNIGEEEDTENTKKRRVEFLKDVEVETADDIERTGPTDPIDMQITPLRRRPSGSSFPNDPIPMQVVSPFRKFVLATSPSRGPRSTSSSSSAAVQELLRSVMQDVMYDFRQETREELVGLHLDLVRMGRVWKNELKTVMDEYMGDIKKLVDENQNLREENERLRRGY